jgi:hypothetical protein
MAEKKERVKIVTPEFRASFPALFQAKKVNANDPNEKAKFSVQMLFQVAESPASKALGIKVVDITPLRNAVAAILLEKLGVDWQKKITERKGDGSPVYRMPFRDGNAVEKRDVDGYGQGVIYVTASSLYKPGVIDANKVEILNPQDVYGGCIMRASVHPYWYEVKGNKGVTFGLDNAQKVRDCQPFSGRTKAEDDFDAIEQPAGGASPVGAAGAGDPLMGM